MDALDHQTDDFRLFVWQGNLSFRTLLMNTKSAPPYSRTVQMIVVEPAYLPSSIFDSGVKEIRSGTDNRTVDRMSRRLFVEYDEIREFPGVMERSQPS